MALFKVFRGKKEALENLKVTDGYAYFTPEDGRFYIDISDTNGVDPVFGTSVENGANRICINEGSIDFDKFEIIDCGTAIEDIPEFDVVYINGGNSLVELTENTVIFFGGNASSPITNDTIVYKHSI